MIVLTVALKGKEKEWVLTYKQKNRADEAMETLFSHIGQHGAWVQLTDDYGTSAKIVCSEIGGVLSEDYEQATAGTIARQIAVAHLQIDLQRALQKDEKVQGHSKLMQLAGAGIMPGSLQGRPS